MTKAPRAWRALAVWLPLLLALPLAAGCGKERGTLSGQVLYQGKPLPGGRLTFRPDDSRDNTVTVPIDPDGHYEATLFVGDGSISVDNRELRPLPSIGAPRPPGVKVPPPEGGAKAAEPPRTTAPGRPAGAYLAIPERYYDVESSGLRYTVKRGEETYTIELQ